MSKFTTVERNIFRLNNGQVLDCEQLAQELGKVCHYVHNVVLTQKDGKEIVALIFPSKKLFQSPDYEKTPEEGCFCPRDANELGRCLLGCMHSLNARLDTGSDKIDSAVIVSAELSVKDGTLTPALAVDEERVIAKYTTALSELYDHSKTENEEILIMKIEQ